MKSRLKQNWLAAFFLLIIFPLFTVLFYQHYIAYNDDQGIAEQATAAEPPNQVLTIPIGSGDAYGKLMAEAGWSVVDYQGIYNAAHDIYDLANVRAGKELELTIRKEDNVLLALVYKIDSEDELVVERQETEDGADAWQANKQPIPYDIKIKHADGTVTSSMYQAAQENDIDERAIIALANAFQWSIDFAMDPRVGDTFQLVYEERYLDGKYIMPGKVLAGQYINDGTTFEVYYFEEDDSNIGYFDADGNSVQKMFLKAPVEFKYISSGYTTGTRVVMEVGLVGPHRAIDYAATYGSPIRAVGDGVITSAGWSGCYGNLTAIRHNATYTTRYAHQSKIIVKVGQRVKQGEVIGYVGSTGCSTGPHVHFEMIKNGVKIDSLQEVLPPGKPIKDEHKERFFQTIVPYQAMFKQK
ncbi:MAG: peptidoglycan DD-metalloendopeptidase family protein [Candidatus Komeilibacteria bacterium]